MLGSFRGCKRKIGIVSLGLACVLTACWIKNISSPTLPYRFQFDFVRTGLRVVIQEVEFVDTSNGTVTTIIRTDNWFNRLVVIAPYWSITIPLILVSAWCLLTKTRTAPTADR